MATTPKIGEAIQKRIKEADEVLQRCRRLNLDPVGLLKAAVQEREKQQDSNRRK